MSKKLVIVESPAKAKTISRFLGSDYVVKSSFGHVRDLPKNDLGIDVAHEFKPTYVIPPKAEAVIKELQKATATASGLFLATDPDREGEAIAWHLKQVLHPRLTVSRISFHEITREAIEAAIKHGREIDHNLVEAQVARRELDRLVGYSLSPLLWKKVARGLSAGRVQSVAVRLVVEREREIDKFKTVEYWSLIAMLSKRGDATRFPANLIAIDGKTLGRLALQADVAQKLEKDLKKARYTVQSVEKKEIKRSPAPPFTTSTLQQEANRKLGYGAKRTMTVAQHLYEDGFITYMRTDSVNLSTSALKQARDVIAAEFGKEYVPDRPRLYRSTVKNAQEAHEAIRPVRFAARPDSLAGELDASARKLYELIWKRAIASQMTEARFERTSVDISAANCLFRATGQIPLFLGYYKVYIEGRDDAEEEIEGLLPPLAIGDHLTLHDLKAEQHFTEPPPRYTEATLVKTLEELGIGRPSTYAPTLGVIVARGYVRLEEKKFWPEDIGGLVTDLLVEHFPTVIDYQFTAGLEKELDDIADGKRDRVAVLHQFYTPFAKLLKEKEHELSKKELTEEVTDQKCPKCGRPLVIKMGRFGKFYSCSGYPECDYRDKIGKAGKPAPEPVETGEKCPLCGNALVKRTGKFGQFIGCSTFPKCRFIEQSLPEGKEQIPCPKCHNPLVPKRTKRGKIFWGCSTYPKCDFATWNDPAKVPPTMEEYEANKAKRATREHGTKNKKTK